jgi:hypothetical protein
MRSTWRWPASSDDTATGRTGSRRPVDATRARPLSIPIAVEFVNRTSSWTFEYVGQHRSYSGSGCVRRRWLGRRQWRDGAVSGSATNDEYADVGQSRVRR